MTILSNFIFSELNFFYLHFLTFSFIWFCPYQTSDPRKRLGNGAKKGIQYLQNYWDRSNSTWFKNKGFDRNFIVTMNRLRADHYNLGSSLVRIKVMQNASCPCGCEEQDIEHVVWSWPLYNEKRKIFIRNLEKSRCALPVTIKQLISNPVSPACKSVHQFLLACKLNIWCTITTQ